MDREKVINEFERWCDEMEDQCPVICLHALALLKEQQEQIKMRDEINDIQKRTIKELVEKS